MSTEPQKSSFTDYLQELADKRQRSTIRFKSVEGSVSQIQAAIVELLHEGHRAIIETDAGFGIGVDQLLEVNGRHPDNFC